MSENSNDININIDDATASVDEPVVEEKKPLDKGGEAADADTVKSADSTEISEDKESKKTASAKGKSAKSKAKKSAKIAVRVVVLVVLFCAVLFAGVIISDMFFGRDDVSAPEIVTITVSADSINVSGKGEVTTDTLKAYLDDIFIGEKEVTVVLINDTDNPADPQLYNEVVDILALYGKSFEKMDVATTDDEASVSTADER